MNLDFEDTPVIRRNVRLHVQRRKAETIETEDGVIYRLVPVKTARRASEAISGEYRMRPEVTVTTVSRPAPEKKIPERAFEPDDDEDDEYDEEEDEKASPVLKVILVVLIIALLVVVGFLIKNILPTGSSSSAASTSVAYDQTTQAEQVSAQETEAVSASASQAETTAEETTKETTTEEETTTEKETTTKEEETTTKAEEETASYVTIDNVNVRAEASVDGEWLGTLDSGVEVTVYSISDDNWAEIDYDGTHAYIYAEYISKAE